MYFEADQLIFSPTDLTQYMDSPFASWMDHLTLTNPQVISLVDEQDDMAGLLQKKGEVHEQAILASFEEQGITITNMRTAPDAMDATRRAMQVGNPVIYQAALKLSSFQGIADFLVKVEGKSKLGDFYYEIWDTKLAKNVKPSSLIQLCCYAEMLAEIQGRLPAQIVVVSGNGEQKRFQTNDYFYYYQQLKQRFLAMHHSFDREKCPDPAESSGWGRWSAHAEQLLKASDHLAQVATITKTQIKKLNKADIFSMEALVMTAISSVKGMHPAVFDRLKAQAAIQKESLGHDVPLYKILTHEPGKKKGLALLPPQSPLDVFFDIEGYPLEEGGLEYLWGISYFDEQSIRHYKDFWAHNQEEERACFKEFIAWVYNRWQQDPSMHIYHYANYEIAACRKLMGRYGTCEFEVDQLLRNDVFIDLYKIVKECLLLGEPRYSIKNVEHLYRAKRNTNVGSGSDSVVVYEQWKENPDGETWRTSSLLKGIRDYNEDDCNSTQELVEWLRLRQKEHGITYLGAKEIIAPEVSHENDERIRLQNRLLEKSLQYEAQGLSLESLASAMLAWSIEFHRREAKPVFWRLFDRLSLTAEELLDDLDCLVACTRTDKPPFKPTTKARQLAYEFSFDRNQDFKGACSQYYIHGKETLDGKKIKVELIKESSRIAEGYVALKMKEETDEIITLIPDEYVHPAGIPDAIVKQAQAFEGGRLDKSAILDFLKKSTPRIKNLQPGQSIASSADPKERLQQIIDAVLNLDNSYITIQGPPGSGKTYTGKHVIAELIKRGKKVGISSNSHKAINNLLISTAAYCKKMGLNGYFACSSDTDESLHALGVTILKNDQIVNNLEPGCVIGTTAWGFARSELEDAFDYLFIDEAGQVSVANLIAMSPSTKNIILMGDQMQLGQPSQGTHPQESGLSLLDYLLHQAPTISDSMGIFLNTTYRMHSEVNKFISEAIYEGKLEAAPANDCQTIKIPENYQGGLTKEAGIIPIAVSHQGNTQASDEEVEQISRLSHELLGRIFTTKEGLERPITWDDMLFVAPYNHQVNKLKSALGNQAKVGSVDKFQGQEAPVVLLSMCASNANESPRGLSFLLDKNRLNVAISRAQSLAIVVYSPALLEASASNPEQLAMINLFCNLTKTDD
ncbi:MAG: TM0106 family RecB-like putative nuclease [Legionella sp.]|nr:TM0106 family RecB-like putative nuclease [Legionella sp.]